MIGRTTKTANYSAPALVQRGYREDGVCFLVSRTYRFVYVKLAKTGSSSVVKILKAAACGLHSKGSWDMDVCPDGSLLDHGQVSRKKDQATQLQCRLTPPSPSEWAESFVFTFVRAAAERRLSTVKYCWINGRTARTFTARTSCGARCRSTPDCGVCPPNHCVPMHPYLRSAAGEPFMDYVGNTSRLNADMATILELVSWRHAQRTGRPIAWRAFPNDTHANVHADRPAVEADNNCKRNSRTPCRNVDCKSAKQCWDAATAGFGNGSRADHLLDEALF